jgi:hypothetical protein
MEGNLFDKADKADLVFEGSNVEVYQTPTFLPLSFR